MAPDTLVNLRDVRVLNCALDGPLLDGESVALDLVGEALGREAQWVAVPVERIPDEFFRLRSGIAGAVVQKSATYRLGPAVIGDISRHLAGSTALRDIVYESNQGSRLWFLADSRESGDRLRE
ncbi:DUF4180 domain-containing protein [Streptomyces sp. NPDC056161]|uniref:DUF4180 domain-containing protein n=1 Tax=Streptomyces sp. NPDC056161 TaxID=3345732 RepID=UPI0035DA27F7